jgi:Sep15/SelM redox domain
MIRPKRQAHRFGAPSRQKRLIAVVLTGLGCIALYTAATHRSVAATTAKLGLEDATDRAVGGLAGADAAHGQTDTMTGGEHEHEHDVPELVSDEAPAAESARLDELEKEGAAGNDSGSAGYVQPPPVHPVSGKPVRAEIITCPACRLNSLPHVKHFVKKLATYFTPGLVVTYISGEVRASQRAGFRAVFPFLSTADLL